MTSKIYQIRGNRNLKDHDKTIPDSLNDVPVIELARAIANRGNPDHVEVARRWVIFMTSGMLEVER